MRYGLSHHGNCCVGLWMLNESGGEAAKRSPASRTVADATYTASGITYRAVGPSGAIPSAITTDGSSGYVALPDMGTQIVATTTPQSWSYWFHAPSDITSASSVTYLMGSTSGQFIWLGASTGTLTGEVVTVGNGLGNNTGWGSLTITAGWHHICLTFNGTTHTGWTLWLDGVPFAPGLSASGGCPGLTTSGAGFRLGNNGTTFYTVTTVAAVAVFSHQLTPAEVLKIYAAGKNGYPLFSDHEGHY